MTVLCMQAQALLLELHRRGVKLTVTGDKLRFSPLYAVGPDELKLLRMYKAELMKALITAEERVLIPPITEQQSSMRGVCPRCNSHEHRDAQIHTGRSVRRDCARCGRFISFPVWYGERINPAELPPLSISEASWIRQSAVPIAIASPAATTFSSTLAAAAG